MQQYKQSEDEQFKDVGSLFPFLKRIFGYAMSYQKMFWGFILTVGIGSCKRCDISCNMDVLFRRCHYAPC